MRRTRPLATQLLLLQIAVVIATVLAGALVSLWLLRQQVDREYEGRSLAIAVSVARIPDVIDAFAEPQPARIIQPIAEGIRQGSGASFVVVANAEGIRYSHPDPERIGQRVSTEPQALSGQPFVGIEQGTLGRSVRAKAPIFDASGRVIGQVSVGFLLETIDSAAAANLPLLGADLVLSLALGIAGSLLLARHLRHQTVLLERQLQAERNMAHALRTQAHEFYNKLHAVSGLIELGRLDDAVGLISRTALVHQELVDRIRERIGDPTLAALLLSKASVASDRGVELRIGGDTHLAADAADPQDLVTVVGNLVDNAIDAAAGVPSGWVEVALSDGPGGVVIRVRDSGPGISTAHRDEIWREGFTTKRGIAHHGLGLALVREIAERRGGSVRVEQNGGTEFVASLPTTAAVAR